MSKVWAVCLVLFATFPCFAKEPPPFQTLDWVDSGTPVLRFTFSKFKMVGGSLGKAHTYVADITAENLSGKRMDAVNLALYLFDKAQVRIGDGTIALSNVGASETVRFEINLYVSGTPASVSLARQEPRSLSVTINSVPQGALVRLDGKEIGTTPKLVDISIGKHVAEFTKEGYATGKFPFEMGPRDVNGGSISYELGVAALDTVELRDGSVISGDLLSISGMEVLIRIGGEIKTYDRNQIKRVSVTHREAQQQ